MDVTTALHQRRSTRQFKADEVPQALLMECMEDARWAPSWSNTQPYRVAFAQGALKDRLRSELSALYDEGMQLQRSGPWRKLKALALGRVPRSDLFVPRDYPLELQPARRATGFGLYEVLGIARDDKKAREIQMRKNYEFFDAPVAMFVFVREELGHYAALDAGLFLQSFLLACHARGLGSCAQGALAVWAPPIRAAFEIPPHYKLLLGCSVGYAAEVAVNAYNPGRAPVENLLLAPR